LRTTGLRTLHTLCSKCLTRLSTFHADSARFMGEEAKRPSEEKYRTLIDHVPDVFWTGDAGGPFLFVSANVEAMFGYSPEELTDFWWMSRIQEDDLARTRESYNAFFEGRQAFDSEFRYHRKNGAWIWI